MKRRPGSEREHRPRIAPADAFDQLLLGREAFRRNAWDEARVASEGRAAAAARFVLGALPAGRRRAEQRPAPRRRGGDRADGLPAPATVVRLAVSAPRHRLPARWGLCWPPRNHGHGQAAEAQERFEDAEADFRKAEELGLEHGLDYVLLMNRGVMRFQRGQLAAAAADFAAAIALDPERYNAYASLAQVDRKLGRQDEAIARLDEAIARAPDLAALYRGRAWCGSTVAATVRVSRRDSARGGRGRLRDLETSARLEGPGSRAGPTTMPAAAGCCWRSAQRTTPWKPPTRPWRPPPTRPPQVVRIAALLRWDVTAR